MGMLICNFPVSNIYNSVSSINRMKPAFCGINKLNEDTFESSDKSRKVKLKRGAEKEIDAVITTQRAALKNNFDRNPVEFVIKVGDKQIGYAVVQDAKEFDGDKLYLRSLYTKYKDVNYKGAGTELLKCAVKESMNRGYNGEIITFASNLYNSPVPFYYKCNFIAMPKRDLINASVHYALKNNYNVNNGYDNDVSMLLNTQGAKAFLEGKRLYEDRICEQVLQKDIKGSPYSANYIQSPYEGEFYVLIAKEDEMYDKITSVALCREQENNDGRKNIVVSDINKRYNTKDTDKNLLMETIEKIAIAKDYDGIVMDKLWSM